MIILLLLMYVSKLSVNLGLGNTVEKSNALLGNNFICIFITHIVQNKYVHTYRQSPTTIN